LEYLMRAKGRISGADFCHPFIIFSLISELPYIALFVGGGLPTDFEESSKSTVEHRRGGLDIGEWNT
jgi:hypothetical protein